MTTNASWNSIFDFLLADSLNAIIGETPSDPSQIEVSHLALVALQNITANANVVLELQTAVYMIDLNKTLIKYVDVENAYDTFVCEYSDLDLVSIKMIAIFQFQRHHAKIFSLESGTRVMGVRRVAQNAMRYWTNC